MEEKQEIVPVRTEEAAKYYSEEKFWDKLKKFGKKAGANVVYAVLLLYYTLQNLIFRQKQKQLL